MLDRTTAEEIMKIIDNEHLEWCEKAKKALSEACVKDFDIRLEPVIRDFINGNRSADFVYEGFSIHEIQKLRGCPWLDAVILMNGYMSDPIQGKTDILKGI